MDPRIRQQLSSSSHVICLCSPRFLCHLLSSLLSFSHHSFSLLNCTSFLLSELAVARVGMVLLGTGLSLTAHFVKSLSFVCDDCPLVSQSSLCPEQQGPEGSSSAPKTLKHYSTHHLHPSIFPGFLSLCSGLSLIPLSIPWGLYPPFDK